MNLNEITVEIPTAEVVAIEYPGFIHDTSKVLRTLGGIDVIATAVGAKHYLKLKLRPEDRTSHPLYGERHEQVRFLLRIARPRQPPDGQPNAETSAAGDAMTDHEIRAEAAAAPAGEGGPTVGVTASIVARVSPTFRFPGLADYAFIPHDPLLPSRPRDLLPYDQRPDRAEPTKAVQPFLLIPQLFSWLDLPLDYAFKQVHSKHHMRGAARSDPNWGDAPVISFYAEGVPPPVAAACAGAAVAAAAAAAAAGEQSAAADATAAESNGQPADAAVAADGRVADVRAYRVLETEVSRLLVQRPVWGLELMRDRCAACTAVQAAMPGGCDAAAVERVVQRLCYRFKTGPWRGLFIRRGYDPRVNVEARKYQAIVYSLPNNWYRNLLKAGTRPGTLQQQQRTTAAASAPEGNVPAAGATAALSGALGAARAVADSATAAAADTVPVAAAATTTTTTAWSTLAPSCQDDLHSFRALPTQQSSTFQLIDLQLKEVQEALQEPPLSIEASRCSEKTGWFPNTTLQRMQNAVQQRFMQLMDELAPPGMKSAAAEATAAAADGAANDAELQDVGGRPSSGVSAAAEQQPPDAPGADVNVGDVEMQEAHAPVAAAMPPVSIATATAATAAAADEALRALMAQMNLRGLSTLNAANNDAAGLFGSDDEDDEFQLLDEQDEQGSAGGRGMGGDADRDEAAPGAAEGRAGDGGGSTTAATASGGGVGVSGRRGDSVGGGAAAARRKGDDEAFGDASDGEDSAMESEYDIGMGEEEEEEEGDEGDEGDGAGGVGTRQGRVAGSGMYPESAYGRVTLTYDGGMPDRRYDGGGGMGDMFGSEDDDEPY